MKSDREHCVAEIAVLQEERRRIAQTIPILLSRIRMQESTVMSLHAECEIYEQALHSLGVQYPELFLPSEQE